MTIEKNDQEQRINREYCEYVLNEIHEATNDFVNEKKIMLKKVLFTVKRYMKLKKYRTLDSNKYYNFAINAVKSYYDPQILFCGYKYDKDIEKIYEDGKKNLEVLSERKKYQTGAYEEIQRHLENVCCIMSNTAESKKQNFSEIKYCTSDIEYTLVNDLLKSNVMNQCFDKKKMEGLGMVRKILYRFMKIIPFAKIVMLVIGIILVFIPDPIPFLIDEIFIIWYIGSLLWGFNNWDIRSCIGEYYKNMIEATCIVDKKLRSETDEW